MKRIGTLSLNINTDDLNYGAILHSYAFLKVLESFGVNEVEVIDYTTPYLEGIDKKYPFLGYLKNKDYYQAFMSILRLLSHAKKYEKFKQFQRRNMRVSDTKYTTKSIMNANLNYNTIICESDVIWSPSFFGNRFDPVFFLNPPSMRKMKRVAYAASVGNCHLTDKQQKEMTILLRNLDAISCRETYAAKYVEELCNSPVECVLDPVLLLDKKHYEMIMSRRLIKKPYVLLYFPLEFNNGIVKEAKRFAKSHGWCVVEVSRYPWERFRHKTIMDAGVEEWLSLIANAEVVLSNSFHAVCFSIVFEKEFYGFSRRTGRKIQDICERVGLPSRYVDGTFIEDKAINYTMVNGILSELRKQSMNYIQRNIIDENSKEEQA